MYTVVEVPIIRFASLLPAVEVGLGSSTGTWLMDTAAGLTCVDAATASRQGIQGWGRLVGHRMNGERVELARAEDVGIEIGGVSLHHDTIAVASLGAFLPSELGELGGVLSLGTFAARPFTLDLPASRLVLETPDSLATRTSAMDELRVRCARSVGGLSLDLFVEVECSRGPLLFEVDSGCTGPTILAQHAAEALGLGVVGAAAGGDVNLPLRGTAPIPTPWVVADVIHDGILGLSVLNRRALTFDIANGRAWLAPTS